MQPPMNCPSTSGKNCSIRLITFPKGEALVHNQSLMLRSIKLHGWMAACSWIE